MMTNEETNDTTYTPSVGDVVLVDTKVRKYRGTWAILEQRDDGKYVIKRVGDYKATATAITTCAVKPIWLENMVGTVVATLSDKQIEEQYA